VHLKSGQIRGVAFGERGHIRGVVFGERGHIRGGGSELSLTIDACKISFIILLLYVAYATM